MTTFVDANPHLLTDHELRDTAVIVDGNNLYHFLYYYFHVPVRYGGDYDTFEACVQYFFRTLATCHVTPYVVFDGGYDADNRKLPTVLRRARDRCNMAGSLAAGGRGKVLPILAQETFRCTLDRLGVAHFTCDSEADEEIAALANHFGCPVMSNDSDFYVYDLTGGFIVFDYINLQLRHLTNESGDAAHYLAVQIYFVDTLLAKFANMERRMVSLFATLQGNDVIERRNFMPFFSAVKLPPAGPTMASGTFVATTKQVMLRLLLWLEEVGSFDDAVRVVLMHTPATQRSTVDSLLNASVRSYTNPTATWATRHAAEQCLAHSRPASDRDTTTEVCHPAEHACSVKSFGDQELPAWFVERIRHGDVPVMALNAVVLRRLILLAQVEVMNKPSTYICALPVRAAIYQLLLSVDFPVDAQKMAPVNEYDRVHRNLRCQQVAPSCDACQLPILDEIPRMNALAREAILLGVLGVAPGALDGLPIDARLIVGVTSYWIRQATPSVSIDHLVALLLCHLKQAAIGPICKGNYRPIAQDCSTCAEALVASGDALTEAVSSDVADTEAITKKNNVITDKEAVSGDVTDTEAVTENNTAGNVTVTDNTCHVTPCTGDDTTEVRDVTAGAVTETLRESVARCCESDEVQVAAGRLARFNDPPSHNRAHPFDGLTVHALSQWQACRLAVHTLNQLLLSPLDSPSPARSFSGTFLYNVSRQLKTKCRPDLYVVDLLGKAELARHFTQLYDAVLKTVPDIDSYLCSRAAPSKKTRKREKKRKGRTTTEATSSGDEKDESTDELIACMNTSCDLSNRYDFLRYLETECY